MTAILYALIAHGGSVIADYTVPQSHVSGSPQFHVNLDAVARTQLSKLLSKNGHGTACVLGHYFHHSIIDGLTLLCATASNEDDDLPRRFLVLNNTSTRSELLARILSRLVNDYNATTDKLRSIESNLQQTTDTLRSNITSILERGEIIDSLVSKSTALKDETLAFRKVAQQANWGFVRRLLHQVSDIVLTRNFAATLSVGVLGAR
ncbi:SNARE domain conatining PROTEINS,putative [Babesia bigemina]|uniref:SNARE domain conatining PROTEINS,putative n=1 Tax=Babesia bigemina TaxID=5866 RepID=A0A061D489_BABBI|nr:SNARE domain conatining PROTEINS,putative [Babesia bigemina]CDR95556.1 SNARE domain conatining PROTEINS,putative [Babesia bigemina]|eukprot:XP_012767742.1 SNARE domain conatining PROTEINS,putative [Babesia bigemina]